MKTEAEDLRDAGHYLAQGVIKMATPRIIEPIVDWVQSHVDLAYDHTGSASGLVRLYPYQIEPLASTENEETRELTLCWSPRLGKSSIWKFSMLKRIHDGGCSGLIVYPNADMAERTNRDTVRPLLEVLPEAKHDLLKRGNITKDAYHLPSMRSIIYYMGGGAQVVNQTANWTVADEVDQIRLPDTEADPKNPEKGRNIDQLKAIRIRMQTFRRRLMIVCSSPTTPGAPVSKNYGQGSRGVWHLRCLGCGALLPANQLAFPLQAGKYAGLQWKKTEAGDIIPDSIRWICPKCGREHIEAEAREMNERGEYIHARPSYIAHRSYQCGALGNPWLWTWLEIAQAQEDSITPDGRKHLYNNILGKPVINKRIDETSLSIEGAIDQKRIEYDADLATRLSIVTMGVDQQKSELAGAKYYVWVARGWDEDGNSYGLAQGTESTLEAMEERIKAEYLGHRVSLALIDQGGFNNADDTDLIIKHLSNAMYYKGTSDKLLHGQMFQASCTELKLILCNALGYQVKLLSLMYDPPRASGYRWMLPSEPSPEYLKQLTNVRPNLRMAKDGNGEAYHNWCAQGQDRRDYFDAEKMALAACDVGCAFIAPSNFRHGNKPLFWRREVLAEALRRRQRPQ